MRRKRSIGERTWRGAARDALPVLLVFAVCPVVALLAPGDPTEALARGRALADAERSLGLLVEPAASGWLARHDLLAAVVAWAYVLVHVPATVGALVWAWLERRAAFARARAALVGTQAIVVCGYLLLPTAPPRMLGELGVSATGSPGAGSGSGLADLLQSPYAAIPSGHVAFAVVTGAVVAGLARPAWARALGVLYPCVVVAEVVATGNHLWVDAVLGALAAGIGLACARWAPVPGRRSRASRRRRSDRGPYPAASRPPRLA